MDARRTITLLIFSIFQFFLFTHTGFSQSYVILPGQGISVNQIDYTWPQAPTMNSGTGEIVINYSGLQATTGMANGFVNIVTSQGWVVQNIPVLEEFPINTLTVEFRLNDENGTNITSLPAYIEYSADPRTTPPSGTNASFSVGDTPFNASGFVNEPAPGSEANIPPVVNIPFEPFGIPLGNIKYQPNHPNIQAAQNQCAPAAVANSLEWLGDTYGNINIPHPNNPGLGTDANNNGKADDGTLVGQLDIDMMRNFTDRENGDPIGADNILKGKLTYLKNNSLGNRISVKHQGMLGGNDYNHAGLTSKGQGNNVTANFIIDEICDGEDVSLGYEWHFVEVVGCGRILGRPFLLHKSDKEQTDVDEDDEMGTDDVDFGWIEDTDDADNFPNLVGTDDSPNIRMVVSQSPQNLPNQIPTLSEWGLILLALLGLSIGMVFIHRKEHALAVSGSGQIPGKTPVFDKALYIKALIITLMVAAFGLFLSGVWYGHITKTDFFGTLLSSFVLAYMLHFWWLSGKHQKNKSN